MKTFIISHKFKPCRVPFKVKANDEDEALQKVYNHMGSQDYHVIGSHNA